MSKPITDWTGAAKLTRDQLEEIFNKNKLQALDNVKAGVGWEPIPQSSQSFALDTRCQHTLYHGARGPGKTITQLMRFARRVGIGYGTYWKGIILDKEYKNLSDLVGQSKRFFPKIWPDAKFLASASEYKWVWPTGEELHFRHAKKLSDYDNFHGHEYPFIGWNELTKYPTGELYDKMMSTNRSSFDPVRDTQVDAQGVYITPNGEPLPPIPLEVFSTTNPNGPGHNWVKRRFIDPAPDGVVVRTKVEVFNPQTQQDEVVTKTQVAIFGSYRENIYLPKEYVATLDAVSDPNLRAAWLLGSWDVNAGGALDDLWSRDVHIKPRFKVPEGWKLDRSFDWGSSHPFSVGWWAEANGEEVELIDGTKWCPPRGTLIRVAEWYGTNEIGTNKGLKKSAKEIAQGIIKYEKKLVELGWFPRMPSPGPADNQIRNVVEKDVDTIETKMELEKVRWNKSDKSPGSRIIGLQLARDRLQAALDGEGPGLYFTQNCKAAIDLLPALPRDDDKPDDIDTDAEDHIWDEVRYRVLASSNRFAKSLDAQFAS